MGFYSSNICFEAYFDSQERTFNICFIDATTNLEPNINSEGNKSRIRDVKNIHFFLSNQVLI